MDEIFNQEYLAEGRYCTGNVGTKANENMTWLSSSPWSSWGARGLLELAQPGLHEPWLARLSGICDPLYIT